MTRLTCYTLAPSFSAYATYAVWSPDGSRIAFVKDALNNNSVYVMNGDGSGQQLLADGYYPAFSPDGSRIAFNGPNADALYVAPAGGGTPTRMSYSGTVVRPTWSPDGTRIAFSNQFSIIVWNSTSDALATIYGPAPGTSWARFPSWSPDGSKIAFVGSDNNIWTIDVGSGAYTEVTHDSNQNTLPGWTPAGRLTWVANGLPFVANADGSSVQQLPWDIPSRGGLGTLDWGTRSLAAAETDCVNAPNGSLPTTTVDASSGAVTLTTDTTGTGATSDVPVQTAITVPQGDSGSVDVALRPIVSITPLSSYNFLGRELQIDAPAATASAPLVISFTIDSSILAAQGADFTTVQIVRTGSDGVSVILPDCDPTAGNAASPDPCVEARTALADDAVITVRTSHASTWDFAIHQRYAFTGFFQPVDNTDSSGTYILNSMKAGAAVPVKFSLNGNQGLSVFAAKSPASATFSCDPTMSVDAIEQTVNAGGSSLGYSSSTGQYTYVWKTDSSWAGTCRQLVVTLADGTTHRADFKFTK
jgi:WD40 repeat protein